MCIISETKEVTESEDWDDNPSTRVTIEEEKDIERQVWEFMDPLAWHNSISDNKSIFRETYDATRLQVGDTATKGKYDVIVEVGCGTGDIIGQMSTVIPRYGLDINDEFIKFCCKQHSDTSIDFCVVDALHLVEWWKSQGLDKKFHKPLVICTNNTISIMPEHMRSVVINQMLALAGSDGLCMISYWNGDYFSYAIMEYYKKNPLLCGEFDIHKHVDWESRKLVTPDDYSTEWPILKNIHQLLESIGIDVRSVEEEPHYGAPHINCKGLGIFVWFDQSSSYKSESDICYKLMNENRSTSFFHALAGVMKEQLIQTPAGITVLLVLGVILSTYYAFDDAESFWNSTGDFFSGIEGAIVLGFIRASMLQLSLLALNKRSRQRYILDGSKNKYFCNVNVALFVGTLLYRTLISGICTIVTWVQLIILDNLIGPSNGHPPDQWSFWSIALQKWAFLELFMFFFYGPLIDIQEMSIRSGIYNFWTSEAPNLFQLSIMFGTASPTWGGPDKNGWFILSGAVSLVAGISLLGIVVLPLVVQLPVEVCVIVLSNLVIAALENVYE